MKKQTNKYLINFFIFIGIFSYLSIYDVVYNIPLITKYLIFFILGYYIFFLNKLKFNKSHYNFYHKLIIFIIFWGFIMIFRTFSFEGLYIKKMIGSVYSPLVYLFPLFFCFINIEIENIYYYLKKIYFLMPFAIVSLLYFLIIGNDIDQWQHQWYFVTIFDIGICLLLFLSHILIFKRVYFLSLLYLTLFLILFAMYGRRGISADCIFILMFFILIRIQSNQYSNIKKTFYIYFIIISSLFITYNFDKLTKGLFIYERFSLDTMKESRDSVFEDFFIDFNTAEDFIIGRGTEGVVLRTIYSLTDDQNIDKSNFIENGFLIIILKGGLLYLIPTLIVWLRAFYLGWFKTNNCYSNIRYVSIKCSFYEFSICFSMVSCTNLFFFKK
jgi:hypothetical protein